MGGKKKNRGGESPQQQTHGAQQGGRQQQQTRGGGQAGQHQGGRGSGQQERGRGSGPPPQRGRGGVPPFQQQPRGGSGQASEQPGTADAPYSAGQQQDYSQQPTQRRDPQQTNVAGSSATRGWGRGSPFGRGRQSEPSQERPIGTQQEPRAQVVERQQFDTAMQSLTLQSPPNQPVQSSLPEQVTPQPKTVSPPAQASKSQGQPIALATRKPNSLGTKGRRTVVETNHLELKIRNSNTSVIHYDVSIEPDKPKRLLRPAIQEFIAKFCNGCNPAFDGQKNLYSYGPLPALQNKLYEVTVNNEERSCVDNFVVTIKKANEFLLSDINNYLNGANIPFPQHVIQALDVILREAAVSRFIKVGRSIFCPPRGRVHDLGNGVELWVGLFQSAVLGWKPYLNIDVAHKGFPKAQTVLNLIAELEQNRSNRDPFDAFCRYIKGLKVDYEIPGHVNTKRTYRVNNVTEPADKLTFNTKDDGTGETMTVAAYFARVKNYQLRYPSHPCLHVGSVNKKIMIPVELCSISKGQVTLKKMDEMQTASMIKHAATSADVRKNKICDVFRNLGLTNNNQMKEFGISVSDQFEKVDARVLNPPDLLYKEDKAERVSRGVWRADRHKFLIPSALNKWGVLVLDRYCKIDDIRKFENQMRPMCQDVGMTISPLQDNCICSANAFKKDEIIRKLESFKGFDIVFVVVPDRGDTYGVVKQIAELQFGILTQCIKQSTMCRKMSPATAKNILLKVNAKLNGINHSLHPTVRPKCLQRPVMIMGADVTHPPPDSRDTPSYAAVTASHCPKAFKYNIEWRLQDPREEIIQDLETITKNQLKFFYDTTKLKPQQIIFFRDGVSDGQFSEVLNKELRAIRRACQSYGSDYQPQITFLVVQKRHHTRFFPLDQRDEDGKNRNVPPGLVVDTKITHLKNRDFYLVSHQSIQGTSRPTKYCVLYDDADMSEDDIEQLTYYLCHLFSRCNRSVSYPAPTYYAHLAAFRAKAWFEGSRININDLQREQNRRKVNDYIKINKPMFFV